MSCSEAKAKVCPARHDELEAIKTKLLQQERENKELEQEIKRLAGDAGIRIPRKAGGGSVAAAALSASRVPPLHAPLLQILQCAKRVMPSTVTELRAYLEQDPCVCDAVARLSPQFV